MKKRVVDVNSEKGKSDEQYFGEAVVEENNMENDDYWFGF